MKTIMVWLIALTIPNAPDYLFLSKFFNSKEECQASLDKIEVGKPITAECVASGAVVPVKPTDV